MVQVKLLRELPHTHTMVTAGLDLLHSEALPTDRPRGIPESRLPETRTFQRHLKSC